MNILADENVDRQSVERLRQDGHTVGYVAEMDPGISDDAVLERIQDEETILLTADRDFGELIFRRKLHTYGIVLFRLAGLSPLKKAEIISSVLISHSSKIRNAFCVISPSSIRIRRPE